MFTRRICDADRVIQKNDEFYIVGKRGCDNHSQFSRFLILDSLNVLDSLILHILQDSVSCGADCFLGDACDATDVAGVLAHLVEDREDGFSQSSAFVSGTFCIFEPKRWNDNGTTIRDKQD